MGAKLKLFGVVVQVANGDYFELFFAACFLSKSGGGEASDGSKSLTTEGVFVAAKQDS